MSIPELNATVSGLADCAAADMGTFHNLVWAKQHEVCRLLRALVAVNLAAAGGAQLGAAAAADSASCLPQALARSASTPRHVDALASEGGREAEPAAFSTARGVTTPPPPPPPPPGLAGGWPSRRPC